MGTAAGMIASMRSLGQVFGIAVAGAVVAATRPIHEAGLAAIGLPIAQVQNIGFIESIHDALYVAIACSIIAGITSLVRGYVRSS